MKSEASPKPDWPIQPLSVQQADEEQAEAKRLRHMEEVATPEEIAAREAKREAERRQEIANFNAMCDSITERNRYLNWLEDNYG